MVRYVGPDVVATTARSRHPEVVGAGRVQAWVVGPGSDERAAAELAAALADEVPVLIDADALSHVRSPLPVPALLTPHAGELAAMLGVERGAVETRQLHHARAAAEKWGAVVVLKGRRTLIAHPDGRVRVNLTGTPWLGTAGAGDVLAGLTGALLACGLDPFEAGAVGAWLHGTAATVASGGGPVTASGVAAAISTVVRTMSS